ncbi:hypothetical protein MTO96_002381 [Rhipicephalus appendiculatus]
MEHSSPEMPLSSSGIQATTSEAVQDGLAVPGEEASGGGIEPASPRSTAEPILIRRSTRARKPPDSPPPRPQHWTPRPSDAAPDAAAAAAGTPADMEIEVDGVEISLDEWTDDSWTPPQGFRAQAKRHRALKQQAQLKDAQASKALQTPTDLTRTSPGDLQTALLKAASLPDLNPANRDQLRIYPRNNTFTVSVATTDRAIAYQRITSVLLEGDRKIEIHMYAPPPDDAIRGISFYAHTFPSDEEPLKDLLDSNPDYQIVGGRRIGRTKNVLITLLGDHLPRWLLHRGGLIRVYPFQGAIFF